MLADGTIYFPLRWTPAEALQLLNDLPRLESSGVIVRVPSAWRGKRPPRPQVSATVGTKPPAGVGAEALLDFRIDVTLDGETLTAPEIEQLLAARSGLQMVRGRWVELDADKLAHMLDTLKRVEQAKARDGLSFAEAMRLVAGADAPAAEEADPAAADWSRIVAGPWLSDTLQSLRQPEAMASVEPGPALHATLRPYQQAGLRWLHLLSTLGLGACLADDMGLGKTMQVLALLLVAKGSPSADQKANVLVAPASLLANWASEIARFAPDLRAIVAHPSAMPTADLRALDRERVAGIDLVITSYGSLLRVPGLTKNPVAPRDLRRGASHQESRRETDAGRAAARGAGSHRPDGHAGGEPSRRPVVDLRCDQSGAPGIAQAVCRVHQTARQAIEQSVRAAARSNSAVHLASPQDRQDRHQRSAGQDRGEGLLRAQPPAGGAVSGGRCRSRVGHRQQGRHRAARHRARVAHAVEADLQSPVAVAGRWPVARSG
jgi:hypothetical protein